MLSIWADLKCTNSSQFLQPRKKLSGKIREGKKVVEVVQEKVSAAFCSLSRVTWKVNTPQSEDSPLRILMNFVVASIVIIISFCILNVPSVTSGRISFFFFFFLYKFPLQEQGNEKTNNGTHYKLQLLYSNGEFPSLGLPGISKIN